MFLVFKVKYKYWKITRIVLKKTFTFLRKKLKYNKS